MRRGRGDGLGAWRPHAARSAERGVPSPTDAGLLCLIAISSEQRTPGIDAPTLKESGVDVARRTGAASWVIQIFRSERQKSFRHDRQKTAALPRSWKKELSPRGGPDAPSPEYSLVPS